MSENIISERILAAIEAEAKKRAAGSSSDELRYARLAVFDELSAFLKDAEKREIAGLRENNKVNTWRVIASRRGISTNAVWINNSVTASTTPETRRAQARKSRPQEVDEQLPGLSVTEVEIQEGINRADVYLAIRENPGAEWHAVVKNAAGKTRKRILDVDGLKRVLSKGLPGKTLAAAASELAIPLADVREAVKHNPKAKWLGHYENEGTQRRGQVTRVIDVAGLQRAVRALSR
ncbi:hypothetical protein [Leifsonia xyli]|uniref:hypothetical protein n=1 Tax=Leifsonia xyli TaxID=1575 RepID=UPI003D667496